MKLWILIKNNPSKCNKNLIRFLKSKIRKIKKKYKLRVVIVYEDLYKTLPPGITKFPVLITEQGKMAIGNTQIIKNINKTINENNTSSYAPPSDNINDYWSQEMFSKEQENNEESSDLMENVRQKALNRTMNHRDEMNKTKKKRMQSTDGPEEREKLDIIQSDSISNFTDDPMAKKFWENQETTPGFDS